MCSDLDSLQQDSAMQLFDDTTFVLRVYADGTHIGTRTNEPEESGRDDDRFDHGVFNGRVMSKHEPADYEVEFTVVSVCGKFGGSDEGVHCPVRLYHEVCTMTESVEPGYRCSLLSENTLAGVCYGIGTIRGTWTRIHGIKGVILGHTHPRRLTRNFPTRVRRRR